VTYPDVSAATYAYNAMNQMASVKDWLGTSGGTTSFTYDSGQNLATVTPPNGTVSTYSYNTDEQLNKIATALSGSPKFSFDASGTNGSLDPDGTMAKFTTTQASGYGLTPGNSTTAGTDTYTYDPLGRMTEDKQVGTGGQDPQLTYNDNGEISQDQNAGGTYAGVSTYAAAGAAGTDGGEVKSIVPISGTKYYFGFNSTGDRTCEANTSPCSGAGNKKTYTFNQENELTGSTDGVGDSEVLSYDGNALLQKTKDTRPGSCPYHPGSSAPRQQGTTAPLRATTRGPAT